MALWLQRAVARLSEREIVQGMEVLLFMPVSAEERSLLLGKVGAALALVATHAPTRFAQLRRDVRRLLLFGRVDTAGCYDPDLHVCELYFGWVKREDVSPELVAAIIVHESEHARLYRLGFGYTRELQERVERICYRAARIFGKRLPNGAAIVAGAEEAMARRADFYAPAAHAERERAAMQQLADGNLVVRLLLWAHDIRAWVRRRRAAQHLSPIRPPSVK